MRQPPMSRAHALLVGVALGVCLAAGSPLRSVGDGGEYLAMGLNLASLRHPAVAPGNITAIQQDMSEADPALAHWDIRRYSFAAGDRRRDFVHFWMYPLVSVPALWLTQLVGASPLVAFTITNLGLLALALWIGLPRLGGALCLLLFGGPIVWWIDKAHTEVFTFSLLCIALLLMKERPWWSLVAAGAAAAQNPPIALLVILIGAGQAIAHREVLRDRRFQGGLAAGLVLTLSQPVYTYLRHGTPSLLVAANLSQLPSAAEFMAVPVDPQIGVLANFPGFAIALIAGAAVVLRRGRHGLFAMDALIAAACALGFLFAFAQATNVHHGGTPSISRYGIWLLPLAIPVLSRARELGGAAWHPFLQTVATVSAFVCVFAFHPGVPQNGREPTLAANFLWTRHPGWHNPLPEIFAETWLRTEERRAPVATPGCEKILLIGRGDGSPFPLPCFPMPVPAQCAVPDRLCYANREGAQYRFVRPRGSAVHLEGFVYHPASAWPPGSEQHVRDVFMREGWWTLTLETSGTDVLRFTRDVHVYQYEGPRRFLFVLQATGPNAEMVLRLPSKMSGSLTDVETGQVVSSMSYDGPPFEPWTVKPPAPFKVLLLSLSAS